MRTVREKNMKTSGRVTIEMALLLPGIMILIVWLVFFMVFLLDMAVLKSEAIRLSDEAAALREKDGEPETGRYTVEWMKSHCSRFDFKGKDISADKISKRLKGRLDERLLLTSPGEIAVHMGKQKITVQGSLKFRWPFSGSVGFAGLGIHDLKFSGKGAAPPHNWEQSLRLLSALQASSYKSDRIEKER